MKNNQDVSKKEKNATVGLVVCFVAMIAIVGMITFSQYQQKTEEQQLAEAETTEEKIEGTEPAQITNTDTIQSEIEQETVTEAPEVVITPAEPTISAPTFDENEEMIWPVDGNVLLSYSMDKTVYFSTLDQYKYNPAIIIGGEVGAEVRAAADGDVTAITKDAQTGTTITVNMGNGYEAVYGQLKDVAVQEGDRVGQSSLLGYISEPTKYYSVEGPNLYFKVLKDGVPVNPMEFLEA